MSHRSVCPNPTSWRTSEKADVYLAEGSFDTDDNGPCISVCTDGLFFCRR